MNNIVAMPTVYKGYRFRSRLEARWAMFFDMVEAKWEFEPQPILVNGEPYLPDFLVSAEIDDPRFATKVNRSIVHEIKPIHESFRIKPVNAYLAGKMGWKHNWRDFLPERHKGSEWHKGLVSMSNVSFFCTGPFSSKIPHGGAELKEELHWSGDEKRILVGRCIEGIKKADIFCAHISTLDSYGTLIELGVAASLGKKISLTIDADICAKAVRLQFGHPDDILGHDLWFAEELSTYFKEVNGFQEARNFHAEQISSLASREFLLIASVSRSRAATISFGDPLDVASAPNCIPYKYNLIYTLCSNNVAAAQTVRAHRFDRN